MPSALGSMERREVWTRRQLLERAQAEVAAARERVERARVGGRNS
ncbi:hypothetical protein ACRAR1_05500 [Streptomyces sanyensis]